MRFGGLHILDLIAVLIYLAIVLFIGARAAKHAGDEEGFFLAGRKLGKLYQFFLNFGQATDANGAVSTSRLVYGSGVSGVWYSFQTVFMNPYYWFMNLWFRRVRLVTVADLFHDRFGQRRLALFYAIFQIAASSLVIVGFGNLVGYRITSSLLVKPEVEWTTQERQSVVDYREYRRLEAQAGAGELTADALPRLELLRDANARGELRSHITYVSEWGFYLVYSVIIGVYIVMGGMAATAMNEAFQGVLIVLFSILLIPFGIARVGGWDELATRVSAERYNLFSATGVTGWEMLGVLMISIVQINGIIGNMGISGSARNEFAARFGAVSGTYAKRFMIILWSFAGLIALGLYAGPAALSEPDEVWGTMSRDLLGPGVLGLMLAGVLAANMSTVAAQTMAVSALYVRNVYRQIRPAATDAQGVRAGRIAIVVVLIFGIFTALYLKDLRSAIELLLTVNVPFGAAVVLIYLWRGLTARAVWFAVLLSVGVNLVVPIVGTYLPTIAEHPALTVRAENRGRPVPVYFETLVRHEPTDPTSPLVGRNRFHVELWALDQLGLDVVNISPSVRNALRFFWDGVFPFVFLFLASAVTRRPDPARTDYFFGKMKTVVGDTPEAEQAALEETRRNPHRFDHLKLFGPRSSWELTKWDRVDTLGFLACCAVTAAIVGVFWLLLRWAAP